MKITLSLLIFLLISTPIIAADDNESSVSMYEPPVPVERNAPRYPNAEVARGGEGWVVVNYMVDKEGKVFDAEVIDSSGAKAFEEASLKALSSWQFTPAQINGQSIESGTSTMLSFKMDGNNTGARRSFVKTYQEALVAIKAGEWDRVAQATIELDAMKRKNHYEAAFLNYLKAAVAGYENNIKEEYGFLAKSLQAEHMHDQPSKYLPDELTSLVRRRLFVLQLEQRYYAEALRTHGRLARYDDETFTSTLETAIEQIHTLQSDDSAYWLQDQTDNNGRWSINLLKQGFGVEIEENAQPLQELKLHCDKKYAFFTFKNGEQYKIPQSWGKCNLIVLGQADSKFTLWQF